VGRLVVGGHGGHSDTSLATADRHPRGPRVTPPGCPPYWDTSISRADRILQPTQVRASWSGRLNRGDDISATELTEGIHSFGAQRQRIWLRGARWNGPRSRSSRGPARRCRRWRRQEQPDEASQTSPGERHEVHARVDVTAMTTSSFSLRVSDPRPAERVRVIGRADRERSSTLPIPAGRYSRIAFEVLPPSSLSITPPGVWFQEVT
jgi:hypothetical protein